MEAIIDIRDMVVVSGTMSNRKVGLGVKSLSTPHHIHRGPVATYFDRTGVFGLYRVARMAGHVQ
jgi:hypothetical protein